MVLFRIECICKLKKILLESCELSGKLKSVVLQFFPRYLNVLVLLVRAPSFPPQSNHWDYRWTLSPNVRWLSFGTRDARTWKCLQLGSNMVLTGYDGLQTFKDVDIFSEMACMRILWGLGGCKFVCRFLVASLQVLLLLAFAELAYSESKLNLLLRPLLGIVCQLRNCRARNIKTFVVCEFSS